MADLRLKSARHKEMARLLVMVEGETEEGFVNDALARHFLGTELFSDVSARKLGDARRRTRRGGIVNWPSLEKDILRHLKQDHGVMIALLVDYYGLPASWPRRSAKTGAESVESAILDCIGQRMGSGFDRRRFVPCVMMHEFEAMLFSDCAAFADSVGRQDIIPELQRILDQFSNPEMINDSPETAPSKRIQRLVPNYNKPLHGNRAVNRIGLETIRQKCPHFANWLQQLETNAR